MSDRPWAKLLCFIFASFLVSNLRIHGQVPAPGTGTAVLQNSNSIIISDPRPLHIAARSLEQKFGWRITYEDPPFDLGETESLPSRPGFLAARTATMVIDLALPPEGSMNAHARVVDKIRQAHESAGNPGRFSVLQNGDFIHIIPVAHSVAGSRRSYQSLLGTLVTFSPEDRSVGEIVKLVLSQVSARRGVEIRQGLTLGSIYTYERQTRGADSEAASVVLTRTFEYVNNRSVSAGGRPVRITWDLLYDANEHAFFFSPHVIAPVATGSSRATAPMRTQ